MSARSRSNARRTGDRHPARRRLTVVVISPNQVKNLRGRYGRPATKTTASTPSCSPTPCAPTAPGCAPLTPDNPATVDAAPRLPRPQRPRRPPRACRQPAARAPAQRLPRRVGLFADIDSPDQPDLPDPLRLSGPRRLAHPQTPGRLAVQRQLLRPHRSRVLHARLTAAPRGPSVNTAPPTRHITRAFLAVLLTLDRTDQSLLESRSTNNSPCTPTRTSSPACPAPAASAPHGCSPRSATAAPASPHPIAGLPGRRRPLDPTVRQDPQRRIPLVLRQTTARRRHRLRRRLPTRQPLGRRPLRPCPRPRPRPPPRRAHPRPRLALRHLALLARQHRLRPRQTPSPPTPHPNPTTRRRLDTGLLMRLPGRSGRRGSGRQAPRIRRG